MIRLRDYQREAVAAVRESLQTHRHTLLCLPTGGGKTEIFAHIARKMSEAGQRTLVLTHRRLLVEQTHRRMVAAGMDVGVICAGYPLNLHRPVQVASVDSLSARLKKLREEMAGIDLTVIDEAHHSVSPTFMRVISAVGSRLLGVTATPRRLDGKALQPPYDDLVVGRQMSGLIADGWLADYDLVLPPNMHDPNYAKLRGSEITAAERREAEQNVYRYGDAVREYRRFADGKRVIAFCYSISDSGNVAQKFTDAGIMAEAVHGGLHDSEVKARIARYDAGDTLVLTTCQLIDEGFDVPATSGIIDLAKTQSLTRYLQRVGRCLRPKPDGSRAVIIDTVGNAHTHGLPDMEREWSLVPENEKTKRSARVKRCEHCFVANPIQARVCRACGEAFPIPAPNTPPKVDMPEAQLSVVDKERFGRLRTMPSRDRVKAIREAQSFDDLLLMSQAFQYKPGWVKNVLAMRGQSMSWSEFWQRVKRSPVYIRRQ